MNDYWKKYFGWSSSRQNTWNTCKLRYYFSYIGKWEGFRGNRDRDKLQWLSRLKPWYMVKGSLVHEAIESQINQWSIHRPVSQEAAINIFRFKFSEVRSNPSKYLIDDINGFPVKVEEFDASLQEGVKILEIFFGTFWLNYEPLEYVKHEEFDSFEIGGQKVWVKIDLVTRMDDGLIVITDWKTGKVEENKDANEAQIGAYVLWAVEKLKVAEDRVKTEIAYLKDPSRRRNLIGFSKEQLLGVRTQILNGSKEMLAVSSPDDFPASPSERNCRGCSFATVCGAGMQFVPDHVREQPVSLVK